MSTTECSCRLWPTPGMYAVTSMLLVRRTRATLRSAEFGFLGVDVKTRTHTPRFWGDPWSAGLSVLLFSFSRPTRTSWLTVGNSPPYSVTRQPTKFTGICACVKGQDRQSGGRGLETAAWGHEKGG